MSELAASSDALLRGFIPRELVKKLFLELNVSRQCVTGAGGYYIPEYADGPDGAFYANELGFGRHNAEPDVVQTSRQVVRKNEDRRELAVDAHNLEIRVELARSRNSIVRQAELKPLMIAQAEGCTGCSSCAPSARVAPEPVVKIAGTFSEWRGAWTPGAAGTPGCIPRALRERQAVMALLQTAAATVRRWRKEERAALYKARKERNAGARAEMQARREEAKAMRRVARRVGGVASTTRR